jgi:hypothetical protein
MGALWLLAAAGFSLAAIAGGLGRPVWIPVALAAAGLSLLLSILAAPESRIGIAVNLLIIAAILWGRLTGHLV